MRIDAIELPELTQREMEAFFAAKRDIREGWRGETTYDEAVLGFVKGLVPLVKKLGDVPYASTVQQYINGLSRRWSNREISNIEDAGIECRAAARCGWLGDVMDDDIADARPGDVLALRNRLVTHMREALEIDPE